MNIVRAWLQIASADGMKQADAIRALNERLGKSYTSSRINEWLDGRRRPTDDTHRFLASLVLDAVIKRPGLAEMLREARP